MVLVAQACAFAMRDGVQNSLGCPAGMLSPPFAFVAVEATIVTEDDDVLDVFAELIAVTVTSGGEGITDGAV